jgi:hypothetical protein
MGSLEFPPPDTDDQLAGPIVVGIPWPVPAGLVHAAAELAEALELHLVCAFVDPASYLTEWEPAGALLAASLDPAPNDEAAYPAGCGHPRSRRPALIGPINPAHPEVLEFVDRITADPANRSWGT